MQHEKHFYIDGKWVDPVKPAFLDVIDPSTEEAFTQIAIGSAADVDRAVAAAWAAFPAFARTTRKERLDLCARSWRNTTSAGTMRATPSRARWARRCNSPATSRRAAAPRTSSA